MIQFLNPDYLDPLFTTPAGRVISVVGGILLVVGTWVMNRMATLHY